MVDYYARNIPDFFQVQKKSGTHFFRAVSKLSFLSPNSIFFFKVSKWLISKSQMVRIEIWDLFLKFLTFTALTVVTGFQTQSFFDNFFEFFFLLKMTQNGSIREKKWSKSKFENFALPTGPWVPDLVIFRRFSKMKTQTIFSTLASRTCFILHIIIVLIVLNHLTTTNYLSGWHKYAKCGQLCIKKFKITIFYQFFDFHCLNTHDIAAYDSTNDNGEGGITNSFILFFFLF